MTKMQTETETNTPAPEVPLDSPEGIIQDNLETSAEPEAVDEFKQAVHALVEALQGLAKAELKSVTDMTQEAYHNIEQAASSVKERADHKLHSTVHEAEDFESRLIKAAKTAWSILSKRSSESDSTS